MYDVANSGQSTKHAVRITIQFPPETVPRVVLLAYVFPGFRLEFLPSTRLEIEGEPARRGGETTTSYPGGAARNKYPSDGPGVKKMDQLSVADKIECSRRVRLIYSPIRGILLTRR